MSAVFRCRDCGFMRVRGHSCHMCALLAADAERKANPRPRVAEPDLAPEPVVTYFTSSGQTYANCALCDWYSAWSSLSAALQSGNEHAAEHAKAAA